MPLFQSTAISALIFVFTLIFSLTASNADAGQFLLSGKTDKDPLSYQPGEEMIFSVTLYEDGVEADGKTVFWTRDGDDGRYEEGTLVSSKTEPMTIKTSLDRPGFVHIQVSVPGEDGKPILHEYLDDNGNFNRDETEQLNVSAGVEPEKITGYPEPADFDAFWARQKERLATIPMNPRLTEIPSGRESVVSYDFRLDAPGDLPVSGYFSKPKEAAPKSLPAYMFLHGYGVHSAFLQPDIAEKSLVVNANIHGIENGRENGYYVNLKKTKLADYGFTPKSNVDPETCYWNGVVLRMKRALEFLKSQPEWDGKTIRLVGGSQGGFQALALAALDPAVSELEIGIPWLCDLSGHARSGRADSFYRPTWTEALGYYDGVNFAKRIHCPVTISAGLGDYVCPPSGVALLFNHLAGPKTLTFTQGRTHMFGGMPNATTSTLSR